MRERNLQLSHELHVKSRACAELEQELERREADQKEYNDANSDSSISRPTDVSGVEKAEEKSLSLEVIESLSEVNTNRSQEEEEGQGIQVTGAGDVRHLVEQMSTNYNKFRLVNVAI